MFDRFSATTGLKPFGFARNASSTAERVFWYCLIIVGSLLTCVDVWATTRIYLRFPTGTKVTQVNNDTINLGEPTLCITPTIPDQQISLNELNLLLKDINSLNDLIALNSTQHPFVDLTIYFASELIRVEQSVVDFHGILNDSENSILSHFRLTSKLLPIIRSHFSKLNISLRKVAEVAGVHICNRVKLRVSFYDYQGDVYLERVKMNACMPEQVVWLGITPQNADMNFLCLKLTQDFFTFASNQDTTIIKWYSEIVDPNASADSEEFASLELSGGPMHLLSSDNLLWIPVYTGHTIGIYLTGQYNKLNQEKAPCGSDLKSTCLIRCRYNFIKTNCGCSPVFDFDERLLPICGTSNSSSESELALGYNLASLDCQRIKLKFQPDTDCASKCFAPCSYKILSFFYMEGKKPKSGGTRVSVFVNSFSYHLVTEISLVDSRQYLGSLGGSLSLYLGASFVVLIHVSIFWVAELAKLVFHSQPKQVNSGSPNLKEI